jgi:hypothetical protein
LVSQKYNITSTFQLFIFRDEMPTQPAMMTFKAFLQSLPDNISDQDAIKKFNEYKVDFKKQLSEIWHALLQVFQ